MRWVWIGMVAAALVPEQVGSPKVADGGIQGVVTTTARPSRPLRVTFDQKVCGAEVPDDSIVAAPSGALANAVVTLVGVKAPAPPRQISVRNEECAFVPRVQVAGSGATMRTSSRDHVLHTTTVQRADGRQMFNLALPMPGIELSKTLDGTGPLRVGCSTHQWMRGWIVISDEVAVVTGADGRFAFPKLAPGTYRLHVWHEALEATDHTVQVRAGTQPAALTIEMR